ncbi:NXPE family member 4-like [Antedon mediterranea]
MFSKLTLFISACISVIVISIQDNFIINSNISKDFIRKASQTVQNTDNTSIQVQTNSGGMIDVMRSSIGLKNPDRTVKVGDFFSVIIQARDQYGQNCKGGDFFFATIGSESNNASGKITDFKNGTYEVLFFAGWPGVIDIYIMLVHPSEAVDFIEQEIWPLEKRIVWKGIFGKNKSETTKCSLGNSRDEHINECKYVQPLATGETALYCDKPKHASCDSLNWIKSDTNYVNRKFAKFYKPHQLIFSKSVTYIRLLEGTTSLTISNTTMMSNMLLPECKADLPKPRSDGFWTNNVWTSLQCKTKQWTKQEVSKCINGKHIVLMGDSTTRQWTEHLLAFMGVTRSINTTKPSTKHIQHHSNIMMLDFYFHPYSIGSIMHIYRVGKWEYEILDNLNVDTCNNYVIMVSPWAHYAQWTKESFIERLHLLRETLVRFMKRCPGAKILMKTPHPRNHSSQISLLYGSDKLLYDIYELYFSIFSGLGIHILDIWDMNLSYPSRNTIHMPTPVILQELFLMFSHICTV